MTIKDTWVYAFKQMYQNMECYGVSKRLAIKKNSLVGVGVGYSGAGSKNRNIYRMRTLKTAAMSATIKLSIIKYCMRKGSR